MSELKNLLDSKTMTLGDYLNISSGGLYEIPFSQRKYEWDKYQINRIWNDIIGLYNNNEDIHLLNFFTLSRKDDGTLSIYDGQQRTISCLIILSIISQKLKSNGSEKAGNQIQREYFVTEDNFNDNSDDLRKITFDNKTDSDFFYEITNINYQNNHISNDVKNMDKNSNKRSLLSNYGLLNQKIDDFILENDTKDEKVILSSLYRLIIDKCYLIVMIAEREDIAARMFESLNNTGKDLEKYYVLKNDMVRCLGEANVKDSWEKVDYNTSNLNHNNFLTSFATVLNGKTTSNKSLDAIYKSYDINSMDNNSRQNGNELLNLLLEASNDYMMIFNTNQFNDRNNKSEVIKFRKLSNYLAQFNFKQHVPIILSMMLKNKSAEEMNKVLWAILVVCVRNFFINGEKSNTVENSFADYAQKMFSEKLDTDELVNNIYGFSRNDTVVKSSILDKEFTVNKSVKTLLIIIYNNQINGETEINKDDVDLEHILPKSPDPKSNWISEFPNDEDRIKYTYKLGNLTLWLNGNNRRHKNADFNIKRESYKDSPLYENHYISTKDKWSKEEIDDRTNYLADKLLNIFSLKE